MPPPRGRYRSTLLLCMSPTRARPKDGEECRACRVVNSLIALRGSRGRRGCLDRNTRATRPRMRALFAVASKSKPQSPHAKFMACLKATPRAAPLSSSVTYSKKEKHHVLLEDVALDVRSGPKPGLVHPQTAHPFGQRRRLPSLRNGGQGGRGKDEHAS